MSHHEKMSVMGGTVGTMIEEQSTCLADNMKNEYFHFTNEDDGFGLINHGLLVLR